MDNVTVSESQSPRVTANIVTIGAYTPTAQNAEIVCNCLLDLLMKDIKGISDAMDEGQQDGILLKDWVWPDEGLAWQCELAIAMVNRDLERLQRQALSAFDIGCRLFQIEATLTVIRAAAPAPDGYVCRCIDRAIKRVGVIAGIVADELVIKGATA